MRVFRRGAAVAAFGIIGVAGAGAWAPVSSAAAATVENCVATAEQTVYVTEADLADAQWQALFHLDPTSTVGGAGNSSWSFAEDGLHMVVGPNQKLWGTVVLPEPMTAANACVPQMDFTLDDDSAGTALPGINVFRASPWATIVGEKSAYGDNWWSTKAFTGVASGSGYTSYAPFGEYFATNADLTLFGGGFALGTLGGATAASSGTLHSLTFNGVKYVFTTKIDAPAATFTDATDCTSTATLAVPEVDGVDYTVENATAVAGSTTEYTVARGETAKVTAKRHIAGKNAEEVLVDEDYAASPVPADCDETEPTTEPTEEPTEEPTVAPTDEPSTASPTSSSTATTVPTALATDDPSDAATAPTSATATAVAREMANTGFDGAPLAWAGAALVLAGGVLALVRRRLRSQH